MDITYRAGEIEDCRKLAELNYIASGGVVEFLFHDTKAIKLYRHRGFEIESRLKMDAHELIPHEGGALLMKCVI